MQEANNNDSIILKSKQLLKDIENKSLLKNCVETLVNKKEDWKEGEDDFQFDKEPFFLEDQFKIDPEGGLEFLNQELLKKQRGVLPAVLKSLGNAILNGKPLGSISLPYEVVADYSILERTANTLTYAPQILEKGGETIDPYEQFCIALAHWIANFHISTYQVTPIEPLIGETFQGKIGGCPVYVEQMTPYETGNATMGFYLVGKNFTLGGAWVINASIWPNSVKGQYITPSVTHFKNNGTKIHFIHPYCQISGTAFGKRTVAFGGKFYCYDRHHRYFAELEADPPADSFWKKKATQKHSIKGRVLVAKDTLFKKLDEALAKKKPVELKITQDDYFSEQDQIEGSWMGSVKVGKKEIWKYGAIKPHKLYRCEAILPSDSNLREDALWKRIGDDKKAEQARETMKIQELNDIKSMKKGRKQHEKK